MPLVQNGAWDPESHEVCVYRDNLSGISHVFTAYICYHVCLLCLFIMFVATMVSHVSVVVVF